MKAIYRKNLQGHKEGYNQNVSKILNSYQSFQAKFQNLYFPKSLKIESSLLSAKGIAFDISVKLKRYYKD